MRFCSLIFLLFLLAAASIGQESNDRPETIDIDIYYRHDPWVMAPTVMDGSDYTRSIFYSVERAINPRTGEPYDQTLPTLPFDPKDLLHSFRLEKKEFLLGEPILIEHWIELKGPGHWTWGKGGNYRARGRDDNYFFVLRDANGLIVSDVDRPSHLSFGGLFGIEDIAERKPFSYWLALQRYSSIMEPGTYDLYCLTGHKGFTYGDKEARNAAVSEKIPGHHYIDENGYLVDQTTGEKSRSYDFGVNIHYLEESLPPLADLLPPEVLSYAKEQSWGLPGDDGNGIGVLGHFKIVIRRASNAEQMRMVKRWTKVAESIKQNPVMGSYHRALLNAIWYAKQQDFLPLIERWISASKSRKATEYLPLLLSGLAARSDSSSFSILLKTTPSQTLSAFSHLDENRVADAIPLCISWLSNEDSRVRSTAESRLLSWTGQSFEHTWEGYNYERPTLKEGRRMQLLWQQWWAKNRNGFQPRKPCNFPCLDSDK